LFVWWICAGLGIGSGCGVLAQAPAATATHASAPDQSGPDAQGIYKVGGDVRMPIATYTVEADFSAAQKKTKKRAYSGSIVIGLVVDVNGVPQQVHIVQGLGPDFDAAALAAVRQYRFKPAMKGDAPVPVYTTVGIDYQFF
jgi:protein TonB